MACFHRLLNLLVWASLASVAAAEQVREIPGNWQTSDLRRITVVTAAASSALTPDGEQYAPVRAVDGQRGTKWVASVAPSQAAPQWITLRLPRAQPVSALAVFGERIGNDGIQDAQVQVAGATPGEFQTVATIADAKSGTWLATFDPVKTDAVRLWITRSSGPSPHTDVYEIEVYGPPIPPAELKAYAAEALAGCVARGKEVAATAEKLSVTTDPQFAELRGAVASTERAQRELAEQFARWDSLSEADRHSLAAEIECLEAGARRTLKGLATAAAVWPGRAKDIAAARKAASQSAPGETVTAVRDGTALCLVNSRVSVVVSEVEGAWDATWLGSVDAAVRRVRFAIEVNGKSVVPEKVRAESAPFTDASGSGMEIRQTWGQGVEIERRIRVYHGRPAVVVAARIANKTDHDVTFGTAKMLHLSEDDRGWWHLAGLMRAPAAVGYPGASPPCRPAPDEEAQGSAVQQYTSSGVLALAQRESPGGMTLGALSAQAGRPSIRAAFQTGAGGTSLEAALHAGALVRPGQTLAVDPVWLSVEANRYDALERYGDAVAALTTQPVRTGANALWCSWYPIRMGISEEIVLAHAEIAAKHFKPLGMEVIQLDHGWQRGDICGDWFPNERFPHGLKWLSEQLQSRYGMKLGLWIAPTNVAFTSQLFRDHPDWLMKTAEGKPASIGRWFWVPNPEMGLIDASQPGAEQWIEETFARLTAEGARYYKIDFIAGSPALRRAMAAIRRGAGPEAWIRYCQTPPLSSVGLASSAYLGDDTGDAGLANWIHLERVNAPLLAASYWVNDRLYHREVCDMSAGMKASVEEARFKMSLMTLSGCSISFSDDFRPLDPSRIRMMQQCLPPGNPPARPRDLFERERPSLWHMHCKNAAGEWDAVGVFNFEDETQERTVELSSLGLPADSEVVVFEFWQEEFLGTHRGRVTVSLPPRTARILLIHRLPARPAAIATNLHVLGGYHEIQRLAWDEPRLTLSGRCRRMPGVSGRVYLYVPAGYRPRADAAKATACPVTHVAGPLWSVELVFNQAEAEFAVAFERSGG